MSLADTAWAESEKKEPRRPIPKCPRCDSNSKVWEICGVWTCHREGCHPAAVADRPWERKDTNHENPKEAAGRGRIPLHLIPDGPLAWVAMAFHEGASKYDPYNWRTAGVRAGTYVAAARRHIAKWWNREDADPVTRVHHLANAVSGLLILMDAEIQGNLTDDRPPYQGITALMGKLAEVQKHLSDMEQPEART